MKWDAPLILVCFLLTGCHVPPRAATPAIPTRPVSAPLIHAPRLRLHIATIAGATIPQKAVDGTRATLERHLGHPVEVYTHPDWDLKLDALGPTEEVAAQYPVWDRGQVLTTEHVETWNNSEYRLGEPDNGIIGARAVPVAFDVEQRIVGRMLTPIVDPDVVLVVVAPGSADGRGHTGWTTFVFDSSLPENRQRQGLVVLRQSAMRRHANWFVSEAKLFEWTLTHEIGHVLGVPSSADHAANIPGYGGAHCTHPECVMYTGVDWRVVVSGLLHGWPLDYCDVCAAEIAAERAKATPPGDTLPHGR